MIALLLFTWAICLSGVSTFFSVHGLMDTYPGIPISIAIMGSFLETSKLVIVSALHSYWKTISFLPKAIITIILMTLMVVTAVGINGYLAKGHLMEAGPEAQIALEIDYISDQETTLKQHIAQTQQQLALIDQARQGLLEKQQFRQAERQRVVTQKEATALQATIQKDQQQIDDLETKKFPLQQQKADQEIKLGPIKSLGDLLGLSVNADIIKYVNAYFALIFDPLSLGMIIIAQIIWATNRKEKAIVVDQPKQETVFDYVQSDRYTEELKNSIQKTLSNVKIYEPKHIEVLPIQETETSAPMKFDTEEITSEQGPAISDSWEISEKTKKEIEEILGRVNNTVIESKEIEEVEDTVENIIDPYESIKQDIVSMFIQNGASEEEIAETLELIKHMNVQELNETRSIVKNKLREKRIPTSGPFLKTTDWLSK